MHLVKLVFGLLLMVVINGCVAPVVNTGFCSNDLLPTKTSIEVAPLENDVVMVRTVEDFANFYNEYGLLRLRLKQCIKASGE